MGREMSQISAILVRYIDIVLYFERKALVLDFRKAGIDGFFIPNPLLKSQIKRFLMNIQRFFPVLVYSSKYIETWENLTRFFRTLNPICFTSSVFYLQNKV